MDVILLLIMIEIKFQFMIYCKFAIIHMPDIGNEYNDESNSVYYKKLISYDSYYIKDGLIKCL